MNKLLHSFIISIVIASICLMAGLMMIFVVEPPRTTLGGILVGLSLLLDLVAFGQFVRLARAKAASEGRND